MLAGARRVRSARAVGVVLLGRRPSSMVHTAAGALVAFEERRLRSGRVGGGHTGKKGKRGRVAPMRSSRTPSRGGFHGRRERIRRERAHYTRSRQKQEGSGTETRRRFEHGFRLAMQIAHCLPVRHARLGARRGSRCSPEERDAPGCRRPLGSGEPRCSSRRPAIGFPPPLRVRPEANGAIAVALSCSRKELFLRARGATLS